MIVTGTQSVWRYIHTPYEGDCKHENLGQYDSGYGYRYAIGCKGIGIYAECPDCKAHQYSLDSECCTEEEHEWHKNSPFSKGWVTVKRIKECQSA